MLCVYSSGELESYPGYLSQLTTGLEKGLPHSTASRVYTTSFLRNSNHTLMRQGTSVSHNRASYASNACKTMLNSQSPQTSKHYASACCYVNVITYEYICQQNSHLLLCFLLNSLENLVLNALLIPEERTSTENSMLLW